MNRVEKYFLIVFAVLLYSNSHSQTVKDTVYIFFDSTEVTMEKVSYISYKSKKYPNEVVKTSYSYKIDEKTHENPYLYDTGYTFAHFNQSERAMKIFNTTNPLILTKNKGFLNTITPLDADFFRNTDYIKVCKTFEAEDSHEQDVIIFILDKDEIKDGKMVLREVDFSRPVKQ